MSRRDPLIGKTLRLRTGRVVRPYAHEPVRPLIDHYSCEIVSGGSRIWPNGTRVGIQAAELLRAEVIG